MTEPTNRQILDEASAWFIEFRTDKPTARAREEFMQWLRRSPEHIRAYLEISEHYVQMPGSANVSFQEADRLLQKARSRLVAGVVPIEEGRAAPPEFLARPGGRVSGRPFTVAIAASVLILASAVMLYLLLQRGVYSTGPGEERTVTLEDASRIELNARTRLRVRYTTGLREIELVEGQALFQVAKDSARPFVVRTNSAQVRAVGTEFDVYRHGAETRVTVLEGIVAVQPALANAAVVSPTDFLIGAGEQAVVPPDGKPKAHPANAAAATAWTRGELEFIETPLTEVAEEFNRYSPRRLVLESPSLANLRISGIYSSVDPASLVLFLRSQPDLTVVESGPEIRVFAKKE
jgi:transmembrane sensor